MLVAKANCRSAALYQLEKKERILR